MTDSHPAPAAIPVVCDRCRAEGLAAEDPFAAFGALLDFDPVPRRRRRPDGWDEEVQRAFIAALSLTGSVRSAARAVGRATFGVNQLLDSPGSDGFRAAMDEAFAIAADERSRRLADGLRAVAAEQSGWRPPDPPWARAATRAGRPPAGDRGLHPAGPHRPRKPSEYSEEERREAIRDILEGIVKPYTIRLRLEREARLRGEIVAADFYLRQITFLEVMLDMVSGNGVRLLQAFRIGQFELRDIAETPMSRLLDAARRDHWEEIGEPVGPEHPPRDRLKEHDGFSTEPLETIRGGPDESRKAQQRAFDERHAADAKAQIEWEAEARRDYEARRAASQPHNPGEPPAAAGGSAGGDEGEAGRPAAPPTGPTSRNSVP